MLIKPSQADALGNLDAWLAAPSRDYRSTLSWLAVLGEEDYRLYSEFVATSAEIDVATLNLEVDQRRRLLQEGPQDFPPGGQRTGQPSQGAMVPYHAAPPMRGCPYCGSHAPLSIHTKVSGMGWLLFWLLLVTTCVFAPIGLVFRNRYQECPTCRGQLPL